MEIIPFGKYKGQPVEVLMSDKQYLEWLVQQDWFKQRYQNLNTIIINNFNQQSETPEHNKLQALFVDNCFVNDFINHLCSNKEFDELIRKKYFCDLDNCLEFFGELNEKNIIFQVEFEKEGVDVKLNFSKHGNNNHYFLKNKSCINIEIKPSIGDDYPAILRQMHANNSTILLAESFNAIAVSINQVKKIFSPSKINIILKNEIQKGTSSLLS